VYGVCSSCQAKITKRRKQNGINKTKQ
jgi:hypothetical protein